jgi:uncharacterized protein YecT (DUF1311 family)
MSNVLKLAAVATGALLAFAMAIRAHAETQSDWLRADGALNHQYQVALDWLRDNPAAQRKLRTAQHAWIINRDASCNAVSGHLDEVRYHCLVEETVKRTEWLKSYIGD